MHALQRGIDEEFFLYSSPIDVVMLNFCIKIFSGSFSN